MNRLSLAALGFSLIAQAATAAPVVLHGHDTLALAPDGGKFVDVEDADPGNLPEEPHGIVMLRGADGKVLAQFDPCKSCKYDSAAWSAKGDAFAFIGSDQKAGKATLYVVQNGQLRIATAISGVANTIRFSPEGSRIALLATVGAHKITGAIEAGAALVGEIGQSNDEQRIAILPAKGGALRFVSSADRYVYEYDWTPDGNGFVVTSAKGNGDNNWWVATLGYVDASNGTLRIIAAPKMQMDLPRVSPDGKMIAFIGGLMSDWRSIGGDVYTVPLAGGAPVNVTANFHGTFRALAWRGKGLMTAALVGDRHAVIALDPATHATKTLWSAPVSARTQDLDGTVVFSADGAVAATILEDFNRASEVAIGRLPKLAAVTQDNAALTANVSAQSVSWTNENFHLQGWLIGPKQSAPGKHAMVVIVHGGPSSAVTPHYVATGGQHGTGFDFAYDLIQKGTYIFYPNDRGSYGQGEAFTRANIKDFGRGDLRDMLCGGRGRGGESGAHRRCAPRALWPFLWRLDGDVGEHADPSLQGHRRRRGHRQLVELLWRKRNRSMDGPVLRRVLLR